MQKLRMAFMAGASMIVASAGAGAQLRVQSIPAAYLPPAGMCRVWMNGVAPGRQPAPTDCASARAHIPANSRLVYGSRATALRPNDPRDPRNGTYDPRYDPRSPQYDPRTNGRDQGGWWGRGQNDDGRNDRGSDKERRKLDKERRKDDRERDKEWRKHGRGHDRDEGDDEDDDDDEGHDRGGRRQDRNGDEHGQARDQGGWWGRGTGDGRGTCVDTNRGRVCGNQPDNGRVRIP